MLALESKTRVWKSTPIGLLSPDGSRYPISATESGRWNLYLLSSSVEKAAMMHSSR